MFDIHFLDALNGKVFSQSATPLGLAIPIYTATSIQGGMPIWNPPGSGVNIELISVDLNYGSGTSAYTAIGLMAGSLTSIGTATGCSAFAATTPVNGNIGFTGGSKCQSSNAGTVTVTAGTATPPVQGAAGAGWIRSLASMNLEAQTGTAHGTLITTYWFKGTVCVPPGWLIYLAATLATVSLLASSIVWKEVTQTR